MRRTNWFERIFPPIQDNGLLPGIIERLEGTPARLNEKVKSLKDDAKAGSQNDGWSIKKEIGHLADLEPLWYERLHQVINGESNMKEADLTNRKTHDTPHDDKTFDQLIAGFKTERQKFIAELRLLKEATLIKHPCTPA